MSVSEQGTHPYPVPGDSSTDPRDVARVHASMLRKGYVPVPPDAEPRHQTVYDATAAARAPRHALPARIPGAALGRPRPAFTPAQEAPAPLVQDAMPGDGRLRWLLAHMAATCARTTEPIFSGTCGSCQAAAGRCRLHQAMHEESSQFRRLALALGGAATDQDAVLLLAAAASAGMLRAPERPEWPGRRDRAVLLLTGAESAALPDASGCCTDTQPCAGHARDQETAQLVGAIRDAAIDAGSAAEAALLITAVLAEGVR